MTNIGQTMKMIDIHKILVPVDFSEASQQALSYGIVLAKEFEASLIVAHIVEFSPSIAYTFPAARFELTKIEMEAIQTQLKTLIPEDVRQAIDYRFILKAGNVVDELLAAVADEGVGLVVMGTHGRRGFKRWVLGSVTEHLLRRVPAPVLTVSHTEDLSMPACLTEGRILYATDLYEGTGRGLEIAYDWARRFAAELTVFHVLLPLRFEYGATYLPLDLGKDHEALHRELAEQLEKAVPEPMRLDPKVHCRLGEGVPYEVILQYADDWAADLIIIHLQGSSYKERTLIGSTAERVVRGASKPVLAIPVLN